MRTEVKITGLDGMLNTLRSLPPELVSKRGGAVKLALAKGARMLQAEAKSNLQRSIEIGGDRSTGLLMKNLVVTRGKPPSGGKGERYLVRVRHKVYPDRTGKTVTTRKTGALLEYGSQNQPATPWLRPAVQSKGTQVIQTVRDELLRRLDLVVKKLAKMNGGR